jgi:hypothetical protein
LFIHERDDEQAWVGSMGLSHIDLDLEVGNRIPHQKQRTRDLNKNKINK